MWFTNLKNVGTNVVQTYNLKESHDAFDLIFFYQHYLSMYVLKNLQWNVIK